MYSMFWFCPQLIPLKEVFLEYLKTSTYKFWDEIYETYKILLKT
jgi:hypothetical protein